MATMSIATHQEFKTNVLESSKLVLVDFWAEWCPPCRAMAPILESVSEKMKNDVVIVKVNIESSPEAAELATEYGVQGIPNMQVFRGGKVVDELVGMRPEVALLDELKAHIDKK